MMEQRYKSCSLSMNGCKGDPRVPIGTIETRTFPAVASPALAADSLDSAICNLKANPPVFTSGIIRLQVSCLPMGIGYPFLIHIVDAREVMNWPTDGSVPRGWLALNVVCNIISPLILEPIALCIDFISISK